MVGSNLFDDVTAEAVTTSGAEPTAIPSTPVRPNRPMITTAFTGVFEPTAVTTFANYACQPCGVTGLVPTAPRLPSAGDGLAAQALVAIPATGTAVNLAAAYTKDFVDSTGLGTISGVPVVRIVGSLRGIAGSALFGVGFATAGSTATDFAVNGSYALASYLVFTDFSPILWVSTTAVDAAGNLARHRRLITDPNSGVTLAATATPGIPTVTAPGAASTGSPAVSYADRLAASAVLTGFALTQIVATDAAGRSWRLLREDRDAASGTDTVQLPMTTGLSGLAVGAWSVRVENFLLAATGSAQDEYVLEDRLRQPVTYARAKAETFAVQ